MITIAKLEQLRAERIGQEITNIYGSKIKIIDYKNNENVKVLFPKYNYETITTWRTFEKGKLKSPYCPSFYGHGFIGEGQYSYKNNTKAYSMWQGMLRRCYDFKYLEKKPTYEQCEVCEEWHNFQNFAQWFEMNYYEIEDSTMNLDKDILIKNNKVYGPDTCLIVPSEINSLFTKTNAKRGNLPIGVDFHNNKFRASMNIHGKHVHIGVYDNIEDAFSAYKMRKETYIQEIADEYRYEIPEKLYEAMYNYEVEWED